ncbi:hypothetical protein ASC90_19525 [Rhizobium sp. Root1220]|nr:hypothetical protein ASC90_19525 [Rhizobium sp. Root1220]
MFADHPRLQSEPFVLEWSRRGWPLISRRPEPGERIGISVGLPLPPNAGKKRLSLVVQEHQIQSVDRPPTLNSVDHRAPSGWLPTLRTLDSLASRHGIEARVFGSLGWSVITGLNYLTATSDLDFLFYFHRDTNLVSLVEDLARIESAAPMRLDGELIRSDGAGVNWREFDGATGDVLVKSISGATMSAPAVFRDGGALQ